MRTIVWPSAISDSALFAAPKWASVRPTRSLIGVRAENPFRSEASLRRTPRHALGVLDEAVEGRRQSHQARFFASPYRGDGPGQRAMGDLSPELHALPFQPRIQDIEIGKAWHGLPEAMAHVLDVLLNLSLFPACCWIAELRIEQVVAGHGQEAGIDLALFAVTNPVHCCPHIVVDPAPRHAAQNPERVVMGIEQHLVRLKRIRSDDEGAAVRQLEVRDL